MTIEPDELRGTSLCRDLSDEELARVAEWFDATSVSEGVKVAGEGAPGEFRRLQEAQPEIAARLEAAMAERVAER
jgi:hypothetical protein